MYARTSADVALAMLFYGGIAGGVLLADLAGETALPTSTASCSDRSRPVTTADLTLVAVLGVIVIALSIGLSPQLFAVCQDEEHAKVSGVPVRLYSILIAILAAVTITVAMRTVGLLLVSALMVVPVAASQQLTRSFRTTHFGAMAIGLIAALGGVVASYEIDTQPGPTIVILALAIFAVAAARRSADATQPQSSAPSRLGPEEESWSKHRATPANDVPSWRSSTTSTASPAPRRSTTR